MQFGIDFCFLEHGTPQDKHIVKLYKTGRIRTLRRILLNWQLPVSGFRLPCRPGAPHAVLADAPKEVW
jgi:hypothetical protein